MLQLRNEAPQAALTRLRWARRGGNRQLGQSAEFEVAGTHAQRNRYYEGPKSDHFDGERFLNSSGAVPRRFIDLLRWQLGGGRAAWPRRWPSPHPPAVPAARLGAGQLRVTMVGHGTLLVQLGGLNILTDPVWSERVSPFSRLGPKRVNAPGIAWSSLPPIDVVLVSHNHYDHLDLPTLAALRERCDPLVLTPLGNDTLIRRAVPGMRVAAHDWDVAVPLPASGALLHVEQAQHWSARGMRDQRMALWAGFVVEAENSKVYFAGDTGFAEGLYRRLHAKHGGLRLAILPIGAYAPRWFMQPHHQNPEEAADGMLLSGAWYAAGCHWGTFHLTNEPIAEPRERLAAALAARHVPDDRFRALTPGQVWDIPATAPGLSANAAAAGAHW